MIDHHLILEICFFESVSPYLADWGFFIAWDGADWLLFLKERMVVLHSIKSYWERKCSCWFLPYRTCCVVSALSVCCWCLGFADNRSLTVVGWSGELISMWMSVCIAPIMYGILLLMVNEVVIFWGFCVLALDICRCKLCLHWADVLRIHPSSWCPL